MVFDALRLALRIYSAPASVAQVRGLKVLPEGMTTLLAVNAGDTDAIACAVAATSRSSSELRLATAFFVEQILLDARGDDFRLFGSDINTPLSEVKIRRQWLMKWLHPDQSELQAAAGSVDRSVFASRVVASWERVSRGEAITLDDPFAERNSLSRKCSSREKRSVPKQALGTALIERLRSLMTGR